jgi:hypothetical protein
VQGGRITQGTGDRPGRERVANRRISSCLGPRAGAAPGDIRSRGTAGERTIAAGALRRSGTCRRSAEIAPSPGNMPRAAAGAAGMNAAAMETAAMVTAAVETATMKTANACTAKMPASTEMPATAEVAPTAEMAATTEMAAASPVATTAAVAASSAASSGIGSTCQRE